MFSILVLSEGQVVFFNMMPWMRILVLRRDRDSASTLICVMVGVQ